MPISSFPISVKSSVNLSDINIDCDLNMGANSIIMGANSIIQNNIYYTTKTPPSIILDDKRYDLVASFNTQLTGNFSDVWTQSTSLTDVIGSEITFNSSLNANIVENYYYRIGLSFAGCTGSKKYLGKYKIVNNTTSDSQLIEMTNYTQFYFITDRDFYEFPFLIKYGDVLKLQYSIANASGFNNIFDLHWYLYGKYEYNGEL